MAKKLKSFPKAPKANASAETWNAYAARKREVNKENAKILAERKKKENARKAALNIKPVGKKK